jgi:peptidoglycan/xylan/chitin deacetylase (PgdA/CDA1 family)
MEFAIPLLQEYSVTAIFFIIASYIGQSNAWNHRAYCFENHLSALDLKNLVSKGFEVGNHSLTHHRLTKLSDKQLNVEFHEAHGILKDACGVDPIAFSYPYGHADQRCMEICKATYKIGFASDKQGTTDWLKSPSNIRRIYIAPGDTPEDLDIKIARYRSA